MSATRAFILYLLSGPSGKKYIGITSTSLKTRWREHLAAARRGSTSLLHRAIRKYGSDSFTLTELLRTSSWNDLCQKEREAIASFQTYIPRGYNLTLGGEGSSGRVRSAEERQKVSLALTGRTFSDHSRSLMSASRRVTHNRPETRAKLSKARLGSVVRDDVKTRISETLKKQKRFTNNKLIPEDIRRIREQVLFGAKRKDVKSVFGISLPNICLILNRTTWYNVA